ncbi:MAG: NADP-dependent oxidoreductase [Microbacterium sp.]|uniref:NADP-dependent oxidoreductase n=1 Tax=Microbacterium ginsengisoli TaxID=400772 RepID=A0A0F0LTM9_9MICO|nr:NADP-dependent oxidoreductase [Microbacterium ginsengisoli]KJL36612.1 Phthiocerol synthesis polyketide synthase type I PpsC [Microbacterium ginsengisoli]MAL07652.1 NADP-dependent oxidoreductase [Microbacterium sp.]MBN9207062.1 NADP-dependent oxidoreductase [Microbacterium ginsengisoli]HAN23289.1 NADP-dependent oxidoreductase [Microbacterium ginsengisoli]
MKSVQIVSWGTTDDLEVRDIPTPEAGAGQVRVKVQATGLNPVDWKIIEVMQDKPGGYGAHIVLPSGNGNDYAGVVDQVGEGVTGVSVGDAVFGGSRYFAQAEYVVDDAGSVIPIPDGLTVAQAGGLDIVGRTAVASVRQVAPQAGETVLVSAAAGGVGVIAAQLVRLAGARVIGTASPANHGYLTELGIEPVAYGDGLVERLRELAPEGIDAVLDNQGRATLEAAVELGVPTGRINTIAEHSFAAQHGISSVGGAKADNKDLAELAGRIAAGEILFPIDSVYPLDQVTAAYAHLKAGHLRGKVVLEP